MNSETFENFKNTSEIPVPVALIDQVIGQDSAVSILRQAAQQKRFVLLVGEPGTGKSMLGKAMAELLSTKGLRDILALPNEDDKNVPQIKTVPAGEGRNIADVAGEKARRRTASINFTFWIMISGAVALGVIWAFLKSSAMYFFGGLFVGAVVWSMKKNSLGKARGMVPRLLVTHRVGAMAPFVDATGSQAGSLLGDVRHDPYQSGGVETPTHELVEAGAIHRANGGVLYIDEAGTLGMESQQNLLTAIQDKAFSISGRSPGSSGMMVRTDPVPCDFHLILAGNVPDLEKMHPALRSRIRGYGYEVFTQDSMPDTPENRLNLVRFVAQEVKRDGRIPHFDREAALEVVHEARRQSGTRGRLSLKLRNLGGLVRAAGDLAQRAGRELTTKADVLEAKNLVKPLELQMMEHRIAMETRHVQSDRRQARTGQVQSVCVVKAIAGAPLTVACEATRVAGKGNRGQLVVDDDIRSRVEGAVQIAGTLLAKRWKKNLDDYRLSLQVLQRYPGMEIEKDSAAVVCAVLSAVLGKALRQDMAVLGSVHINGDLHPADRLLPRLEAAIQCGLSEVVVPIENIEEGLLDDIQLTQLSISGLSGIEEVMKKLEAAAGRVQKKKQRF